MKNIINNGQKGFAVIEIMIFAVVIIAIAGIGYWALDGSKALTPPMAMFSMTIEPTTGQIGTTIKFKSTTTFKGSYKVNFKRPNGTEVLNVATISPTSSKDSTQATYPNVMFYKFPATLCSEQTNCAQVIESAGIYSVWLTQNWTTSSREKFTLNTSTPTPTVCSNDRTSCNSVSPTPINTSVTPTTGCIRDYSNNSTSGCVVPTQNPLQPTKIPGDSPNSNGPSAAGQ